MQNAQLQQEVQQKEEANSQLAGIVLKLETRQKKALALSKVN